MKQLEKSLALLSVILLLLFGLSFPGEGARVVAPQDAASIGDLRGRSTPMASLATGDVDGDGELDLVVKFNRRDFQALIPPGATSGRATVRWKFADWTTSFASSEIRVVERHGGH